jgi:hypothetical protein
MRRAVCTSGDAQRVGDGENALEDGVAFAALFCLFGRGFGLLETGGLS